MNANTPKASKEEIFFLWQKYINSSVSIRELDNALILLQKQNFKLDYLLFCLKYIIRHKMNLQYPAGLKYFVDREEILKAYRLSKIKKIDIYDFKVVDSKGVNFTFNKNQHGFHKILKNDY